jgi:predicted ester cyclase
MSIEEIKALVSRWSDDIYLKADEAAIDELCAANFVFHYPGVEVTPDRDGFKQTVSAWLAPFADNQMTIEDMLVAGDKVTVRWTWRGEQVGEYMGIAPTGKLVMMTGISILHIVGGKIVEEWGEMDNLGAMVQLGVFPA